MQIPAYWLFMLLASLAGSPQQPPADFPRDLIANVRTLPAGEGGYACGGAARPGYCRAGEIALSDEAWRSPYDAMWWLTHEVGHGLFPDDGEYGAEAYACRTLRRPGRHSAYNFECREDGTLAVLWGGS